MRKLIISVAAMAAMMLAGCQQEMLEPASETNVVSYSVEIPEVATKATVVDDGSNINDLVYAVYRTQQASLEDAIKANDLSLVYQRNPNDQTTFVEGKTVVRLELVNNQNYVILFWAQVSDAWVVGQDFDLTEVTYPTEMEANNSGLAAFAGVDFLEKGNTPGTKSVTLYRPFAQINVGTITDIKVGEDPVTEYTVELTNSAVRVNGAGASFNVLTQKAEGNDNLIFDPAEVPGGKLSVNNIDYTYAAMNYIFANGNVNVEFDLHTVSHGRVNEISVPAVPVEKNYRTNIVGNLLTSSTDYTVTLEDDWGPEGPVDDDYVVNVASSAQEIQEAIESIPDGGSGEIKLGGDINLGDLIITRSAATLPIVIPENKSIVLDLNGCKISAPYAEGSTTNHTYAFENHGVLTIKDTKGEGKIVARGNFNYGTMTLESGTIEACDGNGGYGVRNYEGAEFVMNGGTVATIYEDGDIPGEGYDACPIRVDQGAKAEIKGGIINNVSNFTVAIDNYGETIVYDGTFTSVHTTLANSAVMTINGGSFTCNGLEGITAHALWAAAGTTTINGGRFDGKDNYNGFNVDASKGAKVYIKGGEFLSVHSGSLYGDGTIEVTGGTFFDDPSPRVTDDYTVVKDGDVYKVNPKPAVAKIGETTYTSLQKAVAAVEDGGTITLVADETFTKDNYYNNGGWKDGLGYSGDKSFTIDLDGHTISQNGALNDYLVWIKNVGSKENTITFKNGTMDAGKSAYCALCTASSHENKLTVNLENITLINENSNGSTVKIRAGSVLNVKAGTKITGKNSYLGVENWNAVVNIYDGAEIYMNGTTSYNGCLVGVGGNGTINVYGGYGKGVSGGLIAMTSGGTINAMGGEWIANTDGTYANSNKSVLIAQSDKQYNAGAGNAVINVTGGTFKGGYNCYGNAVGDAQINIKGGNFNADPESYVVDGYRIDEVNGIYTVLVDPAAKIGETEYATLQEALNVGGNVTLLRDVNVAESLILPEGKTSLLDLNGMSIKGANESEVKHIYALKNYGILTIVDNTDKKEGSIDSRGIYNYNQLTLESGKISAIDGNGGYAVNNQSGSTFVMNGGWIAADYEDGDAPISGNYDATALNVPSGATATINGGKITNAGNFTFAVASAGTLIIPETSTIEITGRHGAISVGGGQTTINAGTYKIPQNSENTDNVLYVYGGTMEINAGTFIGDKDIANGGTCVYDANGSVTINGGVFSNSSGGDVWGTSGTIIKGGVFENLIETQHIAEGYEMNENGEVVKK